MIKPRLVDAQLDLGDVVDDLIGCVGAQGVELKLGVVLGLHADTLAILKIYYDHRVP